MTGAKRVCLLAACGLLVLSLSACVKNRFMSCEVDLDCKAEDPAVQSDKPYCHNLRCVQCRTTQDCKEREACNRTTNECQSLR